MTTSSHTLLQRGAAAFGAVLLASCAGQTGQTPAADLILANARVYTVETAQPWAEAVAIDEGKIVAVRSMKDIQAYNGAGTRTVDLGGRLLMPAFGDAHVHPVFGGMAYTRCSLHEGKTLEDYQRIITACVAAAPGDAPVYGVGWQDALFPPKGVPRKEALDAVTTQRPLIFESIGGHTYWVNSKTLEIAGITKDTPDPANGHIDRDPVTGEPVGGLQEAAMGLVGKLIPKPSTEELQQSIVYVAHHFNSLGITNWHDAGIDLTADGTSETLAAYHAVKDRGALTAHVSLAFKWENERGLEQIPVIVAASERAAGWGISAKSVKFYVDGVIPQQTAAMIAPYAHAGDHRGPLQIPPETLTEAITTLGKEGLQPHVHAIGDRATRVALDAFAAAIEKNGTANRPMVSHLNIIDPADQPRFGALGVIAQLQPTWSSNYPYMDLTKQAVGPVRSQYIYPAHGVVSGGGMIAYGADWPVATANPLHGLQVAVTRVNYEDTASPPLLPGEAITLEEAIRAHTINVAYANGFETLTGSIAPGKSADLIILDRDIFTLAPLDIGTAKVMVTLFEGKPVFGNLTELGAAKAP
ncbi:amidohydrolase [Sphingosinicella soli]|uniref:Amidohydrolase 3 domain-containing protein n=1 Tax=Sphingosinicella soli TaxID=333708 RepID=A0A7W7AYT7_9SPHN|nr:amidohydrolase [Sphingosinicella soli]MBB4630871.1 hypothetical protein [Sphingosinicella soli]